ncbi:MAG: hypothetical protein WBX25_27260 [Rhodomicrobium sp.]
MIEGTITAQPAATKPPRRYSESPAAKRARRHRQRKKTGSIAPPPREVTFEEAARLVQLDWLDQQNIRDPDAVSHAIAQLRCQALHNGFRKPKPGEMPVLIALDAPIIQALLSIGLPMRALPADKAQEVVLELVKLGLPALYQRILQAQQQ